MKIIVLVVGIAIAFCLFASRQGVMENVQPYIDNPLLSMRNLGLCFVLGLVVVFGWILISKLIERAGWSDDLCGPPY
jgi:hypothetical protein